MENTSLISLKECQIFQRKKQVLENVNLEVAAGEFVYLIGRTGSGKSSLLRTLYGDLELTQGEGHIAGFELNGLRKREVPHLRRKLGIVFQDFQLLTDRTVEANLRFVLKATGWKDKTKISERIEEVLKLVSLEETGAKNAHQLSGGEQQRLSIARALLNDPELILADEPTGNLDPETTNDTMRLLFELNERGRSILMATHDHTILQHFPSRTIKCENATLSEVARISF